MKQNKKKTVKKVASGSRKKKAIRKKVASKTNSKSQRKSPSRKGQSPRQKKWGNVKARAKKKFQKVDWKQVGMGAALVTLFLIEEGYLGPQAKLISKVVRKVGDTLV